MSSHRGVCPLHAHLLAGEGDATQPSPWLLWVLRAKKEGDLMSLISNQE